MADQIQLKVTETEDELISKAQVAVSRCNWVVGECAAKWTRKYARGRTDADFAAMVGLTVDQVYQRRRVFETFGPAWEQHRTLKWSHFYVALNWDDAADCLEWAAENDATVAEMKAWRRALRGEDLSEPAAEDFADFAGDPTIRFVSSEPVPVRDPGAARGGEAERARQPMAETARGGDRETERRRDRETAYAPFRQGAGSPPPEDEPETESPRVSATAGPSPPVDQLVSRLTVAVERVNKALTPEVVAGFEKLPRKLRDRFVRAVSELSSRAAGLM